MTEDVTADAGGLTDDDAVHVALPFDRPRREGGAAQRTTVAVRGPGGRVPRRAAGADDVSDEAWWTAVFVAFLHRYTGQSAIPLVGPPGDGARSRLATYRLAVEGTETVVELATRTAEALRHPVPVPIAQVRETGARAVAAVAVPEGAEPVAGADVGLLLGPDGVRLWADAALWREDTIERMARHLGAMAASADGGRGIGTLSLLDADERRRMLVDWNDTAAPWPRGDWLRLFAEQVARHRDDVAVSHRGRSMTFGELDRRADQIAHWLRARGAEPGARVGLCCPRSLEFVLGTIAILKTGAAVVPLDPVNPDPRLAAMLADSEPCAVLTTPATRGRLPADAEVADVDAAVFDEQPTTPVPVEVTPDTVTHLIYTSGSTGTPKAVLERHEALANLVHWTGRAYGVRPGDRASWLSTPGFAVQIMEWFPYLGLGIPVHVGDPDEVDTPERARDWLVEHSITHTMLVAALAERAWKLPWPQGSCLRIMVTTGERVHSWPYPDLPFQVVMTYGSTETTNVLTCLDVGAGIDLTARNTPEEVREVRPVPVGRPIANLRVYLLDDADQPVPVGVVGRLHVAGAGLAAGYHERPQLTAAKFRPNPLPEEPSPVLYDTGDLARYRDDGAIEILGRPDAQVKIRGFRVELGEVELAVSDAPGVGEAAVVARREPDGHVRLVAYVAAADDDERPQGREVRRHVGERLPHYMVPTVVVLRRLPRLPNGKVDLQALAAPPEALREDDDRVPVAPRDELEAQLAAIWSSLFDLEEVGVHDDFFELGGHSLLAFRLVDLVRTTFGAELSLPELKRRPTIAELARFVRTHGDQARLDATPLEPVTPDPARRFDPFPLTESQQALWIGRGDWVEMGNVGCHGYFEWEGEDLDVARFERAWWRLVERHDALRTRVLPDGTQVILPELPREPLPVLDLRSTPPEEAEARLLALREELSHRVLPVDRPPLFDVRVSLLPRRAPDAAPQATTRTRVHLSLDMLIVDAWSYFQVLLPDLARLYAEDASAPEPIELSFRDYVVGAKRSLEASDAYRRSERYWIERLDTLPPAPRLPRRPDGEDAPVLRFDRRVHVLDAAAWGAVKARGRQIGVTPSVVLTSVFAEVLRAFSGQERFTINFPLFNRLPVHPQVDQLLGVTTTTLLLAVEKADGTFAERAQALQAQLWDDLEHRYFSGVKVLRELTRRRGAIAPAMPIVMTSLVDHPPRFDGSVLGENVYSISQTPQVEIDFQAFDVDGRLRCNWDYLPALFPDGLVERAFDTLCGLLHDLAEDPSSWTLPSFDLEAAAQRGQARQAEAARDGRPALAAAPSRALGGRAPGDGTDAAPPSAADGVDAADGRVAAQNGDGAPAAADTGESWERFWATVERTGRGGDVLWDVDSDEELRWCVAQALETMDTSLPLVDVGCGNGRYSRAFAAHFSQVVGLDVSRSAIERAVRESTGADNVRYLVLDAARDGEVDGLAAELGPANLFVRGVLHVLDRGEQEALVRNAARLVGDEGRILLMETAYGAGSQGYLEFVGGGERVAELIYPLADAGVRLPSHFGRAEVERTFPLDAWERLAAGPVELHAVDPDSDEPLKLPGYFAVLRRVRGGA